MDEGLDYLSSVNIIHDSNFFDNTYKVNLDYSGGNFVGYLEIDPTLTTTGSGTFDVSSIWEHIIASGTIDGIALTSTQITNLQNDLTAQNQFHTLAGTTLTLSYTVNTTPDAPTNLTTTPGQPIELDWQAPIDDGGSAVTQYQIFRTDNQYAKTELPNNSANSNGIDFTDNEFLIQGFETNGNLEDKSTNSISITGNSTSTNGIIGNGIQSADLVFGDSNLPDNSDSMSLGAWVKLDSNHTNTKLLQLNDVNFYVGQTNANVTESYIETTTYSAIPSSSTTAQQCSNWGCTSFTTAYGSTANAKDGDFSTAYVLTGTALNQYIKPIRYDMPYMVSAGADVRIKTEGGSVSGSGIRGAIYQDARNSITGEAYCITYDYAGACSRTTGTVNTACQSSIYSCPFSQTVDVTTTVPIDFDHITSYWATHVGYSSYSVATHYDMNIASYSADSEVDNLIISATIPDTTTEPRHISFTRSGNEFIIYSQGSSVATATNSISLGSNTGQDYTVNLDGMIDEYFINSDVLTSTEINTIYDNSKDLTPIATSTNTDYDDNTVVNGNTYYYSVSSVNSIGDSDYLTPFVSGLAGIPPGVPTGLTSTIQDADNAPLDVFLQWSSPTSWGSGTAQGGFSYYNGFS
jgi:hypothetical protein